MPDMLGRAAQFHSSELEARVDVLGASLEPIMLMFVALLFGTIIISVFLPLYGTLSNFN